MIGNPGGHGAERGRQARHIPCGHDLRRVLLAYHKEQTGTRSVWEGASLTLSVQEVPRSDRPLQTWKTFLSNHTEGVASIDLFVVPTIAFQRLFAFLVLGHERRRLLWFAVTRNPTADWLARQITEAFPWDGAPKYLIRDNDRMFGAVFKAHVRAMGIRDRPTSFRSPWQNGYVERLIGSIRRECTDHLLVFNAEHLRRILAKYATYYNEVRTHVSLGKDAPCRRPVERLGDIAAYPVLGGLHHRYARI
jgi:transposase InsO family protein